MASTPSTCCARFGAEEAKIEDVFKRVRLGVRRASNGRQIPWESTSLEDDFYFIPPPDLKKLSQEELDRQFAEEAAEWDKAQAANAVKPVEDYLRRYPSGRFAELALVRLDRLLANDRASRKVKPRQHCGQSLYQGHRHPRPQLPSR